MGFFSDWRMLRRFRKLALEAKDAARVGELSRLQTIIRTEVHQEIQRRDPELVQSMLDSYLRDAAPEGHRDIVQFLLELGANPNGIESKQGLSSLALAAYKGRDRVVLQLIKHGGDSSLSGKGGFTPLMFAAGECSPSTVSAMLAAGADPNLTTPDGMRAKDLAEFRNRPENLKILGRVTRATELELIARAEDYNQQ